MDLNNMISVNQAAFCATVACASITIGAAIGAATSISVVATVAYAALATVGGGACMGAGTAWMNSDESDLASDYAERFKLHTGIAIGGIVQAFNVVIVDALIKGVANGISVAISGKITGRGSRV